jgi:voltage-gated potassium channel Kch
VGGLRRTVLREKGVTLQVVYAALCLYLLLGLAFAFAYGALQDVSHDAFFSGGTEGTTNDFLYFSLTTLTTTGYGDFTAATEFGRALSVTEALLGQVYLVTVIALLVSNLRPRAARRLRRDA